MFDPWCAPAGAAAKPPLKPAISGGSRAGADPDPAKGGLAFRRRSGRAARRGRGGFFSGPVAARGQRDDPQGRNTGPAGGRRRARACGRAAAAHLHPREAALRQGVVARRHPVAERRALGQIINPRNDMEGGTLTRIRASATSAPGRRLPTQGATGAGTDLCARARRGN